MAADGKTRRAITQWLDREAAHAGRRSRDARRAAIPERSHGLDHVRLVPSAVPPHKTPRADDVIFTIRRIVSGKLTGATPLGPIDLKGLKALDKLTVQVPMTSPYGSFTDQLAYWYYLYIVPTDFNPAKPNGTGAFKYQSFTPGQRSVFTRNQNYWKSGLPYVDSVTIIDFSDSASLQNALTTGVIHGAGALEGPQLAALAADGSVRGHYAALSQWMTSTSSERIAQMRDSAVIINISRGTIVDEEALIAALAAGTLRGAALDVYEGEFEREPDRRLRHSRIARGDVQRIAVPTLA